MNFKTLKTLISEINEHDPILVKIIKEYTTKQTEFKNKEETIEAINFWIKNKKICKLIYGNIETWKVPYKKSSA